MLPTGREIQMESLTLTEVSGGAGVVVGDGDQHIASELWARQPRSDIETLSLKRLVLFHQITRCDVVDRPAIRTEDEQVRSVGPG